MGSTVLIVMAARAQMELQIDRERITASVAERRAAGKDLGGRRPTFTDFQIRGALRLVEAGSRPPRWHGISDVEGGAVPADPGASRAYCLGEWCRMVSVGHRRACLEKRAGKGRIDGARRP